MGGDFNIIQDYAVAKWPPSRSNSTNTSLKNVMDKYNLKDIWRVKHLNDMAFTWSNKSGTNLSRIDYWLISESFDKDGVEVDILPTPLTDHKAIYINLNLQSINHNANISYWKLNNSLLLHNEVQKKVKYLICSFWSKAKLENDFGKNW